jgi:putative chitinase
METDMLPVNGETLTAIAPRFRGDKARRQAEIILEVGDLLRPTLVDYSINTALRIAHFLAQIAHESAGFRTTEEFASGEAYEGRADLGNTQPGDGKRYKGRGLIQLTGRANYKVYGLALGKDFIDDPEQCAEPGMSLIVACEYWKKRNINAKADRDDLVAVTRAINGGTNGLADRRQYLGKAKTELARIGGVIVHAGNTDTTKPVLRRGSQGITVIQLQLALQAAGFPTGIDGDFGPATELAVEMLQTREGLSADGIVGVATWSKLNVED